MELTKQQVRKKYIVEAFRVFDLFKLASKKKEVPRHLQLANLFWSKWYESNNLRFDCNKDYGYLGNFKYVKRDILKPRLDLVKLQLNTLRYYNIVLDTTKHNFTLEYVK